MSDIMIDLETLGVSPEAAILEIAAVAFSRVPSWRDLGTTEHWSAIISLEHQPGRRIEPMTVAWWMQQPQTMRSRFLSGRSQALGPALYELQQWVLERLHDGYLWSRGPSFDEVILKDAFQREQIVWPFRPHNTSRDVRTWMEAAYLREGCRFTTLKGWLATIDSSVEQMLTLAGKPKEKHSALGDAYRQVAQVRIGEAAIRGIS